MTLCCCSYNRKVIANGEERRKYNARLLQFDRLGHKLKCEFDSGKRNWNENFSDIKICRPKTEDKSKIECSSDTLIKNYECLRVNRSW